MWRILMILVIGGSGFIGTRLCKRLTSALKSFKIIDKVRSKTFSDQTEICDIRDKEKLLSVKEDASILINLAAEHRDDVTPKELYDQVNVQGSQNVCDLAEANDIKTIVFTSSVAVYGFAEIGTDENGKINPFNDYGRTKHEAELIYIKWQEKDPSSRSLVIVRPTVVFGEQNRGNVYNLLNQVCSGKFVMIGSGRNRKSMAYVENIAAFIEHSCKLGPGVHIYNYTDKPDFTMNRLIEKIKFTYGEENPTTKLRLPYWLGMIVGYGFDLLTIITRKKFPISSIRIEKFCKDSVYKTSVPETGFIPPINLEDAIQHTIEYEFLSKKKGEVFYTE